jgi:hypothetical protein
MRKLPVIAATIILSATSAFAGDDPMATTFGNTVISTGGMAEIHSHYRADHSFDMVASMLGMSKTFKGTWKVDDKGQLCRTFDGEVPPNTANPLCTAVASHKIGESWTMQTADGQTRKVTLKAGVQ